MRFSKRTEWNTEESDLALACRERLKAGLPVSDLTASNPTRCGFTYPEHLLAPLGQPGALDYDPNPKGSLRAREAVCAYYADHGVSVQSGQVMLTTSTSEAYSYLFKLICDPGDTILVSQPSYPLFDFLADAEVVSLAYTPLIYDHGWQLDLHGLRQKITPGTRAIVLVHPNNPTGHFTKLQEARELAAICNEYGLALIVDEVFLDYPLEGYEQTAVSLAGMGLDAPVFIVSGISKICGLPQMKSAWLVAFGPGAEEALARLEVLADTYLSMNAPVQHALPQWLSDREAMQTQIRRRVQANLAVLEGALAAQAVGETLVNRLVVEGGWYAVLRIPAIQADETTARALLELGVWLHPGYFFGMGKSGRLVVSLLGKSQEFANGVTVLMDYIGQNHKSYLASRLPKSSV